MNKFKWYLITLALLIAGTCLAQDYQADFEYIIDTNSIYGEDIVHEELEVYFDDLSDQEIVDAVSDISELGEEHLVVSIIQFTNARFDTTGVFRNRIVQKIALNSSTDQFRIVAIDFLKDKFSYTISDNVARVAYENILYTIAQNSSLSSKLRAYATSEIGKTHDLSLNKIKLQNLLGQSEPDIINAAARASKNYVISPMLSQDLDYWAAQYVTTLDNYSDINELNSVLNCLALTQTQIAKNYFLNNLTVSIPSNNDLSLSLIHSAGYIYDLSLAKLIMTSTYQYDAYKNDTADTVLRNYVKKNPSLLDDLIANNDYESKLTFIQALRLLRSTSNNDYIDRAVELLDDSNEIIVINAIKALHLILPTNEEETLFGMMYNRNISQNINNLIFFYIGIN